MIKKTLLSVCILSLSSLLSVSAQARPASGSTQFTQIVIPEGYSVPYLGCETPYTGKLRAIVRKSGKPGQETYLLNLDMGSDGFTCDNDDYPQNKDWVGYLIQPSSKYHYSLILKDGGEHRFTTSTIYAADSNLQFITGFAYDEGTGKYNLDVTGLPLIWSSNDDGVMVSSYLPLPDDLGTNYTIIPLYVSDNGLVVIGNRYQINYNNGPKARGSSYTQAVWTRNSLDEPFKVNWNKATEILKSNAVLADAARNGTVALFNGKNAQNAPMLLLGQLNTTSSEFGITTFDKPTVGYRLVSEGKTAIIKGILSQESYLDQVPTDQFTASAARKISENGFPVIEGLGAYVDPYADLKALATYSAYPPADIGSRVSQSSILEVKTQIFQNALDYLINYCNVPEMQQWNTNNWHFIYMGESHGELVTYDGYYSDDAEGKDVLFSVTVDQSKCKKPDANY